MDVIITLKKMLREHDGRREREREQAGNIARLPEKDTIIYDRR